LLVGPITACHHTPPKIGADPVPVSFNWDSTGVLDQSIGCDTPVVIRASTERSGIDAERRFLAKHFPGHATYGQALVDSPFGPADMLTFNTAEGKPVSVCFDISSFFGQLD
jgi:hypothetical protein